MAYSFIEPSLHGHNQRCIEESLKCPEMTAEGNASSLAKVKMFQNFRIKMGDKWDAFHISIYEIGIITTLLAYSNHTIR